MSRPVLAALAVAVLVSPAAARSVLYEHPPSEIVVHFMDDPDAPDAVTYDGPGGMYLLTRRELHALGHDDPDTQTRLRIYELTPEALEFREDHRAAANRWRWAGDAVEGALDALVRELVARGGKDPAPRELAGRLRALRLLARSHEARRGALAAAEALAPGSVKDPARLERMSGELAGALGALDSVAARRAADEPGLGAASPSEGDPRPRASFYWTASRELDAVEQALIQAGYVLDWEPR